jgi:hypothetical protein
MKNFSCVKLWNHDEYLGEDFYDALVTYDIKALEQFALELYENIHFIVFPKEYLVDLLDGILSNRSFRLDKNYVWTDEKIQEIVRVSELFASASERACTYAKSIADKLEQERINNDFLTDYEIEIQLTPYLRGYKEAENRYCSFMDVLCKPICTDFGYILTCDYDDNKFFDRSENWNEEYFNFDKNGEPLDCFKDIYISYVIHELLDTSIWSFQDITNISEICVEVKVKHIHFYWR